MPSSSIQFIERTALAKEVLAPPAGTLARAFFADPLFTKVQPREPRRRQGLPSVFEACLRDAAHHGGFSWTSEAVVSWKPMKHLQHGPVEQLRLGYYAVPFQLGLKASLQLEAHEIWCNRRLAALAPADAMYIYCVGVEPALAGRGIGSDIMRHTLARLAEQGFRCTLRTEQPRNVRFYEKLGFECVAQTVVPVTRLRSWFFVQQSTGNNASRLD